MTKYYVKDMKRTKTNFIKAIYTDGNWIWHITKFEGKGKSIGFGFVKGICNEWGTVYMSELSPSLGINPVPEEQWKDLEFVDAVEDPVKSEVTA